MSQYLRKTKVTIFILNLLLFPYDSKAWSPEQTINNLQSSTEKTAERFYGSFTNTACYPVNCSTIQGIVGCLKTNPKFEAYARPGRFFHNTTNGEILQVIVPVTIGLKLVRNEKDKSQDTYEKITVSVARNIVSPTIYSAATRMVLQHPHCLQAFCKANCNMVYMVDEKSIAKQAQAFKNTLLPITVRGQTYSVSKLRDIDDEWRKLLARNYLIDGQNYARTVNCLRNDAQGALTRILCSQCPQSEGKAFEQNPTCSDFDSSKVIGFNQRTAEERVLAQEVSEQQQHLIEDAIKFGMNINLGKLAADLNTTAENAKNGIKQTQTMYGKAQNKN